MRAYLSWGCPWIVRLIIDGFVWGWWVKLVASLMEILIGERMRPESEGSLIQYQQLSSPNIPFTNNLAFEFYKVTFFRSSPFLDTVCASLARERQSKVIRMVSRSRDLHEKKHDLQISENWGTFFFKQCGCFPWELHNFSRILFDCRAEDMINNCGGRSRTLLSYSTIRWD